MQQSPEEPRRIRIRPLRVVRTAVIVGIVVILAMLLAPLLNHSVGGGGTGIALTGSLPTSPRASTPPQTQPALPRATHAVSVTIRQHDFLVDGQPTSLQDVVLAAKAAAASGIVPPIHVFIEPDSREASRIDLEKALAAENIQPSETESPANPGS